MDPPDFIDVFGPDPTGGLREPPLGADTTNRGVLAEFFGLMRVENMSADRLDAALGERGFEHVWDCQRGSSTVEWHLRPPFLTMRNTNAGRMRHPDLRHARDKFQRSGGPA